MKLEPQEVIGASIPQALLGKSAGCNDCGGEAFRTILISGSSGSGLKKVPLCLDHFQRTMAEYVSLRHVDRGTATRDVNQQREHAGRTPASARGHFSLFRYVSEFWKKGTGQG